MFIRNYKLFGVVLLASTCLSSAVQAQDPAPDTISVSGQDFNLFENVESNNRADAAQTRNTRNPRDRSGLNEPEFTLVGTSRIGSKYSAILRNRDGSEVVVKTEAGTNTRIDGYTQFSVVDVSGGKVSIQYPGSSPCVENDDKGVSCNSAANIASLSLINAAPIQVRRETPPARNVADNDIVEDEGEVIVSVDEVEQPTNPFAALRARAQANGRNSQANGSNSQANGSIFQANGSNSQATPSANNTRRSFTPRRIDPADVPPGMRIVSTPFGDRLIDQ